MTTNNERDADRTQLVAAIVGFAILVYAFVGRRPWLAAVLGGAAFAALMVFAMWRFR